MIGPRIAVGRRHDPAATRLPRRLPAGQSPCPACGQGLGPVSYTHLDVYKRQAGEGDDRITIAMTPGQQSTITGGLGDDWLTVLMAADQMLSLIHI